MNKNEDLKETGSEQINAVDTVVNEQQPTISVNDSLDQLKELIKTTVAEVIAASKIEDTRKQIEEYNSKMADMVSNTQAKIIKPNIDNGQQHIEYVNKVLREDARMRLQSSDGRARYGESSEDFTKAKIIILKKMGLNEDEIARELKDML